MQRPDELAFRGLRIESAGFVERALEAVRDDCIQLVVHRRLALDVHLHGFAADSSFLRRRPASFVVDMKIGSLAFIVQAPMTES